MKLIIFHALAFKILSLRRFLFPYYTLRKLDFIRVRRLQRQRRKTRKISWLRTLIRERHCGIVFQHRSGKFMRSRRSSVIPVSFARAISRYSRTFRHYKRLARLFITTSLYVKP